MAELSKFEMESIIMDLEGDAALLNLVFDQHIDDGMTAWETLGLKPRPRHKLYILTDDEAKALGRAVDLMTSDVRNLSHLFYGTPEAA